MGWYIRINGGTNEHSGSSTSCIATRIRDILDAERNSNGLVTRTDIRAIDIYSDGTAPATCTLKLEDIRVPIQWNWHCDLKFDAVEVGVSLRGSTSQVMNCLAIDGSGGVGIDEGRKVKESSGEHHFIHTKLYGDWQVGWRTLGAENTASIHEKISLTGNGICRTLTPGPQSSNSTYSLIVPRWAHANIGCYVRGYQNIFLQDPYSQCATGKYHIHLDGPGTDQIANVRITGMSSLGTVDACIRADNRVDGLKIRDPKMYSFAKLFLDIGPGRYKRYELTGDYGPELVRIDPLAKFV